MAQINFNNIALNSAAFDSIPVNIITFNGQEIWSSGFTVTFAKSGDGIGTMPDPIKVPAGTVINLTASGSISSGYARYKLGSGSWTDIAVNPISSGAENFGYFYYSYSWGQSSVTVNSDITLTLTSTQIARTYSVNAYAQEGLYFSNGGSSISVSGLSASSIIEFSNSGYCYINGTRYDINRYPDSTPNMYGFDSWGSTIASQEIGTYMKTNSSSTISESARNKVVWTKVNLPSSGVTGATISYDMPGYSSITLTDYLSNINQAKNIYASFTVDYTSKLSSWTSNQIGIYTAQQATVQRPSSALSGGKIGSSENSMQLMHLFQQSLLVYLEPVSTAALEATLTPCVLELYYGPNE